MSSGIFSIENRHLLCGQHIPQVPVGFENSGCPAACGLEQAG